MKTTELQSSPPLVRHRTVVVGEHRIFLREAGRPDRPVVLLLHGFPASSFMFRHLIPMLAETYHVIAPDLPGFGLTISPPRSTFAYTFEALTVVIADLLDVLGVSSFYMYVFDYGAPVGFRLALARPRSVRAIISQNGNAYEEGLTEAWAPIRRYWKMRGSAEREEIRGFYTLEGVRAQYVAGVVDPEIVAPDGYLLDVAMLSRPESQDIQLDLILDYESNIQLYPSFQEYFARFQPPLLAVWGRNDPFFHPEGALSFKHDLPHAEIEFYNTGHFALETHLLPMFQRISTFLDAKR